MLMSSVQGLNPLMFTFALIGNATYVGRYLIHLKLLEVLNNSSFHRAFFMDIYDLIIMHPDYDSLFMQMITYFCRSILVNSLDWNKIRPNLPWLVDAGGCVLLDSLVSSIFSILLFPK